MASTSKTGPAPAPGGTRIVFYGFGAFVGAIKGATQCEWWPDEPSALQFNPNVLVPVDLAMNPTNARAGTISLNDIQCDDHRTDGGLTQIGPRFPQGTMVGACWLSERYWGTLKAKPDRNFNRDGHDYELTSYWYPNGALPGRRFYGVHAQVHTTASGISRVHIFAGGRSKVPGERPLGPFWLDLAQVSDPNETPPGAGKEGALFLEDATIKSLSVPNPKIPKSAGSELYP